jgi:hypothetical protein
MGAGGAKVGHPRGQRVDGRRSPRAGANCPNCGSRVAADWVKMPGRAHTQLNLLTKSYESRSLRV